MVKPLANDEFENGHDTGSLVAGKLAIELLTAKLHANKWGEQIC
jgi:hypothetical protein